MIFDASADTISDIGHRLKQSLPSWFVAECTYTHIVAAVTSSVIRDKMRYFYIYYMDKIACGYIIVII